MKMMNKVIKSNTIFIILRFVQLSHEIHFMIQSKLKQDRKYMKFKKIFKIIRKLENDLLFLNKIMI